MGDWGRLEVLTEQLEPEPGQLIRLVQLTAFRNLAGFLFTPRQRVHTVQTVRSKVLSRIQEGSKWVTIEVISPTIHVHLS
jgi:hypothetical protein